MWALYLETEMVKISIEGRRGKSTSNGIFNGYAVTLVT